MLNKKYDVHKLYVIKESKTGATHYYIGVATMADRTYVEVLTGRKMVVEDEKDVQPLTNFYSLLGVRNYSTGKSLLLTREDILNKTIQINEDYAVVRYEKEMDKKLDRTSQISDLEERLQKAVLHFFPKSGSWSASEFRKSDRSLIQHLRDDMWLARSLQQHSKELEGVFFGTIYNFVKTSKCFKEERHAYEQRIVKWQIGWMMSGGDGWLVSDEYGEDFIGFDENYDIGFRLGIYRTLRAINMDSEMIEEGIEVYKGAWRESCMRTAFRNTYAPILEFSGEKLAMMVPPSEEHMEAWLKYRTYQYYQDHKESVDRYGEVTPEMEMSLEEVEELREYLAKMHDERMAYLEELRQYKSSGKPEEPLRILTKTLNG